MDRCDLESGAWMHQSKPGLHHCYAETFAERFRGVPGHPYELGFDLRLVPGKLEEPLGWKKPRRVFVNSMSDLFHEDVPTAFIKNVFAVMRQAHWHQFQLLTKRPERAVRLKRTLHWMENIWFGVSVESERYLQRVDRLRDTSHDRQIPLFGASLGSFAEPRPT